MSTSTLSPPLSPYRLNPPSTNSIYHDGHTLSPLSPLPVYPTLISRFSVSLSSLSILSVLSLLSPLQSLSALPNQSQSPPPSASLVIPLVLPQNVQ